MPNSPRKNCPTLTIAIYHLKPWTWVLTQFWTFEIISINKKVTAFQTKVVFSFFDISSKLPGWILGTLNCLISFFVVTHISLKILSGLQFSKEFFEILPHWGCFRPLKVQLGALELACH